MSNTLTYEYGLELGKTFVIPDNTDKIRYINRLKSLAFKNSSPFIFGIADELMSKYIYGLTNE